MRQSIAIPDFDVSPCFYVSPMAALIHRKIKSWRKFSFPSIITDVIHCPTSVGILHCWEIHWWTSLGLLAWGIRFFHMVASSVDLWSTPLIWHLSKVFFVHNCTKSLKDFIYYTTGCSRILNKSTIKWKSECQPARCSQYFCTLVCSVVLILWWFSVKWLKAQLPYKDVGFSLKHPLHYNGELCQDLGWDNYFWCKI